MAVRLVAVGYVDDTQRPFHYFCSSTPNGINPIADAHRSGTGQFSFTHLIPPRLQAHPKCWFQVLCWRQQRRNQQCNCRGGLCGFKGIQNRHEHS